MEKVTGIGGVFFKSRDVAQLAEWYRKNLGIPVQNTYAQFAWRDKEHPERVGSTVWALFPTDSKYFDPSNAPLMINYRVENMDRMLEQLRSAGIEVSKIEDLEYGRFAWISDPEGNRIELWEPKGE